MSKRNRFGSLKFYLIAAGGYLVAALAIYVLQSTDFFSRAAKPSGPPALAISRADFEDLNGWRDDDLRPAISAFRRSCAKMLASKVSDTANPLESHRYKEIFSLAGSIGDWRPLCIKAAPLSETPEIRAFFERNFTPIKIYNAYLRDDEVIGAAKLEATGKFTGYFEPQYNATTQPTETNTAPVLTRPNDLIDINLGAFRDELAGTRIAGRLDGNKLVPYPDHGAIMDGAVDNFSTPIAWLDPNDLLFLQIQGSGRLMFPDGSIMRVGYAGQNGHPYTAVGKVLADLGVMPISEISMQSIRRWLSESSPVQAKSLREENKSYVFFRVLGQLRNDEGPLGAQGAALTAGRSLAVDRRYHAMGAPIWIETAGSQQPQQGPIRRLMIAQDTGGAIRGPVRGDFYWGAGDSAGEIAGTMNASGAMFVLLPKAIVARIPAPYFQ